MTVVCMFGLSYVLQVTNFPVLGRAKDEVEFLAITLYLWSAMPAIGYSQGLDLYGAPVVPAYESRTCFS